MSFEKAVGICGLDSRLECGVCGKLYCGLYCEVDSTMHSVVDCYGVDSAVDSAVDSPVPQCPSELVPNVSEYRVRALGELWGAVRDYVRAWRTVLCTVL